MTTLYNCFCQAYHFGNILQNAGTSIFTHYFFYRTSIINIKQLRICLQDYISGLYHGIKLGAKDLYTDRSLAIVDIKFLHAFFCITDQALYTDKFSVQHITTLFLAQKAKWRITHILHRSKQK